MNRPSMSNYFQLILCLNIASVICSSNYFETYFIEPNVNQNSRNAVNLEKYKWPGGIVHYVFDSAYNANNQKAVLTAMQLIVEKTCVKFEVKKPSQKEHIRFLKSNGACGANVGYRPNRTEPLDVMFSEDCLQTRGAIQHELLHVLGLLHEQCRPDRDDFIEIFWDNIDPRFKRNFQKGESPTIVTFNLPYDYGSLMHYPKMAFAMPGKNITMASRKDPSMKLGQSDGPTFYDLEKIRLMYNC